MPIASSVPVMNSSTTAMSSYAYALAMAWGKSAASSTFVTPKLEPPRAGFTMTGSPSRSKMDRMTVRAPSFRKMSWGRATCCGVATPAAATARDAMDLSKEIRQVVGPDPT